MELRFKAEHLRKLACDSSYDGDLPLTVVTAFRKRLQVLQAAREEQILLALGKWLQIKRRNSGSAHHSIQITDEWQLLLEFEDGAEERVAVIEAMVPTEKEHRS